MNSLPDDAVEKIVKATGQEGALRFLGLGSRERRIALRPTCWPQVVIRTPGIAALRFLTTVATECQEVHIISSKPADAVWLVHGLAMQFANDRRSLKIVRLDLDISVHDVPSNLLASCLAIDGLQELRICIGGRHNHAFAGIGSTAFRVPLVVAAAPSLRIFEFVECAPEGLHPDVIILFENAQWSMPNLQEVTLKVADTDFFRGNSLSVLPRLRRLYYRCDREQYHHARFATDVAYEKLTFGVRFGEDARRVFGALNEIAGVDVLSIFDERPMPVLRCSAKAKEIMFFVADHADLTVRIDYGSLARTVEDVKILGPSTGWELGASPRRAGAEEPRSHPRVSTHRGDHYW
jgi:hypothetical protein